MEVSKSSYLPIYDACFGGDEKHKSLNSPESDFQKSLSNLPVDYSVQSAPRTWREVGKDILKFALKVILFPWALYECAKYVMQRIIMIPLYPGQSRIVKFFVGEVLSTAALDKYRVATANELAQNGFVVRHVVLEKDGVRYSGMLMGQSDLIDNGKWALQATGNLEFIEHSGADIARSYASLGYNTLMVNGPSLGRSRGHATPETMGDAQELGLRFLESAVKAKKIVIAGRSLGGAAVAQAVLKHEFKKGVDYLVIRQMTFDSTSNICGKIVGQIGKRLGRFVKKLVRWTGLEIDSVAASRRLQRLDIKEVIVQCSNTSVPDGKIPKKGDFMSDGPILAKASLGYRLVKEGMTDGKVFHCLPYASHMTGEAITAGAPEIMEL